MTTYARMAVLTPQRHISDTIRCQLREAIEHLYQHHLGAHFRLRALWLEVPAGQLYTAGQESAISAVSIGVEDQLENDIRHRFMQEVSSLWIEHTGCNVHQLMLTAPDMSEQRRALALSQNRIRPNRRALEKLKQLSRLLWSRLTRGHFSLVVNS